MDDFGNIVADTIAELNAGPDRVRVLARLHDWRDRVHRLYAEIEDGLGAEYVYDRMGKHRTEESVVQGAGVAPSDVPAIDVLRIEAPGGELRAVIQPRHLWIVGANGRLDLIVARRSGAGRRLFEIIDMSRPMSGASDWRLVWGGQPLEQPPFSIERLRALLE